MVVIIKKRGDCEYKIPTFFDEDIDSNFVIQAQIYIIKEEGKNCMTLFKLCDQASRYMKNLNIFNLSAQIIFIMHLKIFFIFEP